MAAATASGNYENDNNDNATTENDNTNDSQTTTAAAAEQNDQNSRDGRSGTAAAAAASTSGPFARPAQTQQWRLATLAANVAAAMNQRQRRQLTPFMADSRAIEELKVEAAAAVPASSSQARARKSVQIIQSTFLPSSSSGLSRGAALHRHSEDDEQQQARDRATKRLSSVAQFKQSTVLTTHHLIGDNEQAQPSSLRPEVVGQVENLFVPLEPVALADNEAYQQHFAYLLEQNSNQLSVISMDSYKQIGRKIDLFASSSSDVVALDDEQSSLSKAPDCRPINLVVASQGLIIIQCSSSTSSMQMPNESNQRNEQQQQPLGQLVLDQLTHSKLEFNPSIKAQDLYLSPDHRYLVSIQTILKQSSDANSAETHRTRRETTPTAASSTTTTNENTTSTPITTTNSIIYVQLVGVRGLKLQYEIKTSLEIGQCSFVWRDGDYAAVFVSSNHRDQLSEVLSLRLADSRLELMARVPGLIQTAPEETKLNNNNFRYNTQSRRDSLNVLPDLQLASLTTSKGTFIIDLEDNRVTQTLGLHEDKTSDGSYHHIPQPPTLLWVSSSDSSGNI